MSAVLSVVSSLLVAGVFCFAWAKAAMDGRLLLIPRRLYNFRSRFAICEATRRAVRLRGHELPALRKYITVQRQIVCKVHRITVQSTIEECPALLLIGRTCHVVDWMFWAIFPAYPVLFYVHHNLLYSCAILRIHLSP